jgi:hypothetical protein
VIFWTTKVAEQYIKNHDMNHLMFVIEATMFIAGAGSGSEQTLSTLSGQE